MYFGALVGGYLCSQYLQNKDSYFRMTVEFRKKLNRKAWTGEFVACGSTGLIS